MTHTAYPTAATSRGTQKQNASFSTGLSWNRKTGVLRPAAYAAAAVVFNFLLVASLSYAFAAGVIA